jgi:hypothetical protein
MNAQTVLASTGGLPPFEFKLPCDSRPENETTVQSTLELGSPIPDYFSQIDVHGNFIDASLAEFTRSEDDFFGIYHFDFKDFDSDSFTSPHKESFKDDPSDKIEAIAAPNCSGDDPQFLEAESLNPNQAKNNTLPKNPKTSATKKKQISNAAKSLLNNYFAKAFYPKDDQIEALVEQTDLTKKQVKTWFTNKRSRTKTEGKLVNISFHTFPRLGAAQKVDIIAYTHITRRS